MDVDRSNRIRRRCWKVTKVLVGLSLGGRVPSKAATDILQMPDYPHGSTRRSAHSTAADGLLAQSLMALLVTCAILG